jgi:hypothetical protein
MAHPPATLSDLTMTAQSSTLAGSKAVLRHTV